jgi:carboxypeptidase Q
MPVLDEKLRGARWLRAVLIVLLVHGCALSQEPNGKTDATLERIVGAVMTRGGAMGFLETLTDTVGGRVTGSAQSRAAADLILKTLKDAGLENAHVEDYPLAVRWQRGPASGSVVSPVKQPILVGSYGWAPGTAGRVQPPLVSVGVTADGKLSGDPTRLRGAAVLVDLTHGADLSFSPNYVVRRSAVAHQLAAAGAVAMMIQSEKPDRMLYTSAAGIYPSAPLPLLSVAKEDAAFLLRLLRKGDVKLELDIQNTFDQRPGNERNVIAEIPGANPDQIVLLGAHFDSWDPAQGAKDNGSGVAEILEIARILKSLGVKPKATIRFAFFSGEEQACLGSRAYTNAYGDQLERHRVVLITDDGAQKPLGFVLHGRSDLEESTRRLLAPLAALAADSISSAGDLTSDDESFVVLGVPTLSLAVEPGDYDDQHHTITDTLDKVDPQMLALDTAVLAVAAYQIASADQPLGRRWTEQEVTDLLRKTGQLEYVELDYGKRDK